jgi:PAS domain S-box-containing protein
MKAPQASTPLSATLRDFVLGLSDAVLVLDAAGHVVLANAAARQLICAARLARLPVALEDAVGASGAQRVQALLCVATDGSGIAHADESAPGGELLSIALADGLSVRVALHRLDGSHWALRVQGSVRPGAVASDADSDATRELIGMFWDSPFPATLQDSQFRLIAVNEAYVRFSGFAREQLLGQDPLMLQPEEDRAFSREMRQRFTEGLNDADAPELIERRLIDAHGRARWFRAARRALVDERGDVVFLSILQDCTAEHAAREQADRSARDLDQWFDISPLGMVLFDDSGLLLRVNPAFETLAGAMPVSLPEASPTMQQLLAWEGEAPSALLSPGAAPAAREAWLEHADGRPRRVRALVRCYETPSRHRRYMAAVEDMSVEEERDLVRMQIGAMMDTAGVGVATFQESGWAGANSLPQATTPRPVAAGKASMQSIGREMVTPTTLAAYESVQHALRRGERAEARYAIRHPELGLRWLLTRVEPGQLASGKRTTSVVTLDVTDQEQARSHNEQLLRELGTILESSPAGIVYLRGEVVVRCNRRFEMMIGAKPGTAPGRSARELFVGSPTAQRVVEEMLLAVEQDKPYEIEFKMPRSDGLLQWCSLLVRSDRSPGGAVEAIGVLSDITRLKAQQLELEALARDRELMFSLSEVGVAFIRDGRIQGTNEALQRLAGYDVRALGGLALNTLFPEAAGLQTLSAAADAALLQHGRWSGERELRRSDGTSLWVQISQRLVRGGDPSGGIIATFVNVDDRHRAEASLSLQAERTRAVLDSVLVGIVTVGRGGIEWMNRSARRMFGGDLSDFIGQPISTVATPEDEHPFRRTHYLEALVEGQAETFECRVKARDGREFWVAGNAVVTGHQRGGRQLTYAVLDIEQRRQAEVRIAQAQASLQRIIDLAPLAITLRDANTLRVLQINPTAVLVAGKPAEQVIGTTPEDIYEPELAARMRTDMSAACVSSAASRHEYAIETGGVRSIWDARFLPLARPGEAPDQLLLVATDVTEQRAAEQARLDAAIAQREMLVKEVHHRIKNNLQGVAGLLRQTAGRRPEVAGIISEVVGQVQAIAQVYGLQVGASGPLHVHSVAEAVATSVQRTFGRDIALSVHGACAHRWALPEPESIPIALTLNELLTNAVKHGAPGDLDCALDFDEAGVRIAISNPGALPQGFDLARVPGGVSGLGLVRALLPRRNARLSITQHDARVVALIELVPPGVTFLSAS